VRDLKIIRLLFFCFLAVILLVLPNYYSEADTCEYSYGYCCGSCLTSSCGSTCVSGNTCYYNGGLCGFHNCFWTSTCNYYCYDDYKPACNNGCEYCPSCPGWHYSTGAYISCDPVIGWRCNRNTQFCGDSGCCLGGCNSSGCTLTPKAPRACGNCGVQTCHTDCSWGACTGEGECSPGTVDVQACGSGDCTGAQQRTCQADCNWGGWSACSSEGSSCGVHCGTCTGGACGGEGACRASQSPSSDCSCPADGCVEADYYDYPDFGDCDESCNCQGCAPVITYNDNVRCAYNNDPVAAISCCPDTCSQPAGSCTGYTGSNFCLRNDSTDADGESDIVYSAWNIYGWGTNPDSDCAGKCNYTPQALTKGNYTAELFVEDIYSAFSTTSKNFTILQDADAEFECAYMVVGPWLPCDTFGASAGTVVYFKDTSTPSELGSYIVRRDWYFEDGTPASDVGNNSTTTYSSFAIVDGDSGKIILEVEDDAGRVNREEDYQITIKKRTPQWYEVSP